MSVVERLKVWSVLCGVRSVKCLKCFRVKCRVLVCCERCTKVESVWSGWSVFKVFGVGLFRPCSQRLAKVEGCLVQCRFQVFV